MTVAGEIFQVFKDAFNDYQGEIERIKEENRCLREALAEIYNRVQERADKHDTSFIQVKLEVEASPGESDPQESRSHPLLSTPTPANLDKESNFPEKTKTKDENDDSSSSSSLNTISSATVKVEPCRSQDVFSEKVEPEAQAENEPASDEQEPLSCTYCDQTFTEIPQLASHVQSHMSLFTCEVCGKSFKQKGTLKTHMIVHRKDRPFACGYCMKRFKLKSHLKEHERIHTGEKPFSCPVCRMCFTRSNPMKIHLRNHHREQIYQSS
ncbi:gastrula zinc finger protein XlCGF7.1-like [Silurus asotus]|uniref:Gastrula zinc finger protein XlCGF7.1-like n=1 Tax=Silurus asotus TaxID=30991 RepID=A0AAD5FG64_SILAS|nr:gastrula zinc finger protein XlCGF7.1-like [Silurus asotus]